jgi:hypothetical protein
MSNIAILLSPDTLIWVAFCGLVWYFSNRYWKRKALQRARTWAVETNLAILETRPIKFKMHRQRPSISFEAKTVSGHTYFYTLQLEATSWFFGPLDETSSVGVQEQIEVSSDVAHPIH